MLLLFGILLLVLKLAGVIAWAWWIVLIPFYPAAIALLFMLVTVIGGFLAFRR